MGVKSVWERERRLLSHKKERNKREKSKRGNNQVKQGPWKTWQKENARSAPNKRPSFRITCILKLFLAHAYEHVSNALVLEFPLTDTIRIGQPLSLFCPPNHRCIITFRQHIVNTIQMNIGFLQQTRNAAMCVLHIIFIFLWKHIIIIVNETTTAPHEWVCF